MNKYALQTSEHLPYVAKYWGVGWRFQQRKELWATVISVIPGESSNDPKKVNWHTTEEHGYWWTPPATWKQGTIGSFGLLMVGIFAPGSRQYTKPDGSTLTTIEELFDAETNICVASQIFNENYKRIQRSKPNLSHADIFEQVWTEQWGAYRNGSWKRHIAKAMQDVEQYIATKATPQPKPHPTQPADKVELAKKAIKQSIDKRKDEVSDMRVADTKKVNKQKSRNAGLLSSGSLFLYSYLEANSSWLTQAEQIIGHEWSLNFFSVVLPGFAYWFLNNYAFKRLKAGKSIGLILTPLLLGAGDDDYKKNKDAKLKEIDSLEGLLELL